MLDTLRVEQTYIPLSKHAWIIKNQVQSASLTILGFDIVINFMAIYDNQKINESIPDSLFDDKIVSSYLSEANEKDTAYWKDIRTVPLEEDEIEEDEEPPNDNETLFSQSGTHQEV